MSIVIRNAPNEVHFLCILFYEYSVNKTFHTPSPAFITSISCSKVVIIYDLYTLRVDALYNVGRFWTYDS